MTKTKEELEEKVIDRELRGGEEPTDNERLVGTQDESDQDPSDTTPEEAMNEADQGKGIIEKMRHGL